MTEFHVPGNPTAIRERAATLRAKGQVLYDTGDALAKVTAEGWTGRAADHFRDAHELEPERWTKAGNGFLKAAAALDTYSWALQSAQGTAEWAKGEHQRGDDVTDSARTAYNDDVAAGRQRVTDAAANGQVLVLNILPFDDPGESIRSNAVSEFNKAKGTLSEAAQKCADDVRVGCRDAPEEPNWLESGLRFVGGIFEGAGEAIWDLLTLSPFSLVNMVQDMWNLATGDLTPEELMAKYRLSLETAGALFDALMNDPIGFGKELGKGLLDWDTWADDPARALGHLVPDAIIAALTAGTGAAASRGVNAGADGLDALGDLARLNRLDDLGDLNRLDDLGDLSRIDDLGDLGDLGKLDTLTPGQSNAIAQYTGSTFDEINSHLRGTDSFFNVRTPEELTRLSDDISSGLDRLPTHSGETYRGTNLPDSVVDSITPGGTFRDDAFFSSSEDLGVAERFRAGQEGNTLFHIDGSSGRNIQDLSIFERTEAEILFDKGTNFQVVDKVWNEAGGYWDIYLRE